MRGNLLSRFACALLAGIILGAVAASGLPALAHGFYDQCNTNTDYSLGIWTRSQARSFALVGRYEGYHWGGGCWDSDNVDDQPGDPVQNEGTHGEGGDCSGFTFKSWDSRTLRRRADTITGPGCVESTAPLRHPSSKQALVLT